MKSLISSNFNLMQKNSIWRSLKDKKNFYFDDFNNINFSLNDKKTINKYNNFYLILYVNDLLKNETDLLSLLNTINKTAKNNQNKNFIILFLNNKINNDIFQQKNIINFYKSFKNFQNNINNIQLIEIPINHKNFNLRNYYFLRFPLEINSLKLVIKEINKIKSKKFNNPYKLIILDCDNTLWGGVAGEDGIKSLQYGEDGEGKIYEDVQRHLKFLKSRGVLLSISSKNDEKTVWGTLKKREMILKKSDFVCPKINWSAKEQNIREILNFLSLRSEDAVFIDDSEIEIKKVKNSVKKINTYKINDIVDYLTFLIYHKRLQINSFLKEDKKKSFQYKIRNKYEELKKKVNSDRIYNNLKQKITLLSVTNKNFGRALQLFNKTNQFNFTTNRYQAKDIEKILKNKNQDIKLIHFSDKFGDHGIIGLFVINFKKKYLIIEDFVMSCRVINRKIEEFILLNILKKYKKIFYIYLNFIENDNNKNLVGNFLKNSFFSISKKTNRLKVYEVLLNKDLKNVTKFFKK